MEVCFLLQFLPDNPAVVVGMGVREVDPEEAPVRVALQCDSASHDGHMDASRYPVKELV